LDQIPDANREQECLFEIIPVEKWNNENGLLI
jgi:hypothetical protein